MATQELTSRGWWSWLNDWRLPFLWITLTPAVTVPLSAILFSVLAGYQQAQEVGLPDRSHYGWFADTHEYSEVVPTAMAFTLPGLLNLVPFVWVFSKTPRARSAGIVAGLLGLLRLSIPLLVLMLIFDRATNYDGTSYFDFVTEGFMVFAPAPHPEIWFFGAVAWLGSLLVWAVFRVLTRGPERAGLASFFLGIAGLLCLGSGLRVLTISATPESLYVGLPLVIFGIAVLWLALVGTTPVRPKEARHVR